MKSIHRKISVLAFASFVLLATRAPAAPAETAFTYQGRLQDRIAAGLRLPPASEIGDAR